MRSEENYYNTFTLLVFWSVISLVGFSYAGEKMPWLTVHISLPLCLLEAGGLDN
jgi:predicted membrane-bound mannosyltransferase